MRLKWNKVDEMEWYMKVVPDGQPHWREASRTTSILWSACEQGETTCSELSSGSGQENLADISVLRDGRKRGAPSWNVCFRDQRRLWREGACNISAPLQWAMPSSFPKGETFVFLLDLFLRIPFLLWECLCQAVNKMLVHMLSSPQKRGQGKECQGWMPPVGS